MLWVAVGYLFALGGTSAGQGWQRVPHLALAHGPAHDAPPGLVSEPLAAGPRLQTLRPAAEHAHSHGPGARPHTHGLVPQATPPLAAGGAASGGSGAASGLHRHGDVVHDHAPPVPGREAPTVVPLDKHRLPAGSGVAPATRAAARRGGPPEAGGTRSLPVETPPPVGRG